MTNEFIPKGWRLVPVEMTKEMRVAFNQADENWEEHGYGVKPDVQYRAAILAAPTPPTVKTYSPIPLVEAVESLLEDMAMRARMHGNVDPDGTAVLEASRGKLDTVHKELGLARLAHMKE